MYREVRTCSRSRDSVIQNGVQKIIASIELDGIDIKAYVARMGTYNV